MHEANIGRRARGLIEVGALCPLDDDVHAAMGACVVTQKRTRCRLDRLLEAPVQRPLVDARRGVRWDNVDAIKRGVEATGDRINDSAEHKKDIQILSWIYFGFASFMILTCCVIAGSNNKALAHKCLSPDTAMRHLIMALLSLYWTYEKWEGSDANYKSTGSLAVMIFMFVETAFSIRDGVIDLFCELIGKVMVLTKDVQAAMLPGAGNKL